MSGILDAKSRVMDTIITLEGRRQIADGKLKIQYVSFSDNGTFYEADVVSGSSDASNRLYFEQASLPQDQIAFEANDDGFLVSKIKSDTVIKNGQIIGYVFNAATSSISTGTLQSSYTLKDDEFTESISDVLGSSFTSFEKLRIIASKDAIFEDDGFAIGNNQIEFSLTEERPIRNASGKVSNLNHLETLFQDVRLSKVSNFKYLPPVNKLEPGTDKKNTRVLQRSHLGDYKPWGRTQELTPRQLEQELSYFEKLGYSKTIVFEPTSRNNALMGQFFEIDSNVIKKLDVIEYGKYAFRNTMKHVFFVGKVLNNENGAQTFIHLFTLVFG
jgi:hypothetical protein